MYTVCTYVHIHVYIPYYILCTYKYINIYKKNATLTDLKVIAKIISTINSVQYLGQLHG